VCGAQGTPFLDRCAAALREYCAARVAGVGPASAVAHWRGLSAVLSDASVPGEGEHKIMEYIRYDRLKPVQLHLQLLAMRCWQC
jgi:5'-3' exoribonuclease 2